MMKKILCFLSVFFVVSCTFDDFRVYQVNPAGDLNRDDRLMLITNFKNHLIKEGYELMDNENEEKNTFSIRTKELLIGYPDRYEYEFMVVSLRENDDILLLILRLTFLLKEDFTEKYLQQFIAVTKKYFKDATSQEVELVLLEAKNTAGPDNEENN